MSKQRHFRFVNGDNCKTILLDKGCDEWLITERMLDNMALFDNATIEEVLDWLAVEGTLKSATTPKRLTELSSVTFEQTKFGVVFFKKMVDWPWEGNLIFYGVSNGASRFNAHKNEPKNHGPARVRYR